MVDDSERQPIIFEDNLNNDEEKGRASYSQVFDSAGFGKWQLFLLLQCGWANASDAIEIMSISLVMTSMQSTLNVPNQSLTYLTLALFLGMMFGGYIWGSLADKYGRRKVIIQSLLVNSVFSAMSAFSHNLCLLIILRFFSGVGAGGSLPVCFSYFSEFQPKKHRGKMITCLATFWMAGNIVAAALAWAVLPSEVVKSFSPFGHPWRLFIVLCSLPSFTSAIFFAYMPESPLFLMKSGKTEQAFRVLAKVYRCNHPGRSRIPYSGIFQDCEEKNERREISSARCSLLQSIKNSMSEQWRMMFDEGRRKRSIAISWVCFAIAFSYGLAMWIPTLIERAENSMGGSPCSANHHRLNSSVLVHHKEDGSNAGTYIDIFIGSVAQLPANLLAIVVIDRVGGKPILVFGFILTAISTLLFYTSQNKTQVVFMNALFNCATTVVWDAVDVVVPELYETRVRASANGFLTAWSRVAALMGNAVMGFFIDDGCGTSLVFFAVIFLSGAFSSFFLPNTRGVDLG